MWLLLLLVVLTSRCSWLPGIEQAGKAAAATPAAAAGKTPAKARQQVLDQQQRQQEQLIPLVVVVLAMGVQGCVGSGRWQVVGAVYRAARTGAADRISCNCSRADMLEVEVCTTPLRWSPWRRGWGFGVGLDKEPWTSGSRERQLEALLLL